MSLDELGMLADRYEQGRLSKVEGVLLFVAGLLIGGVAVWGMILGTWLW